MEPQKFSGNNPHNRGENLLGATLAVTICFLLAALITFLVLSYSHSPYKTLEEKRVAEIEKWLKKYNKSASFNPPASDRKFWDKMPNKPPKKKPVYDTRLLEGIEEGVIQECAYGTGEWIPLIQENIEIALTCNLRIEGFEDKLDISIATWAAALANAIAMVGDQLDPSLVIKTKAFIQREVINPFMKDSLKAQARELSWEEDSCPWLNTKTNWTAVCVGYLTYAALIVEDDVKKQAQIIARAEHELKEHLKTFGSKGYIASGMRYWNYGFRNFVLVAERLLHATGGNLNLYNNEITPYIAMFPFNYQFKSSPEQGLDIVGSFPNFGDNSNPLTMEPRVLNILAKRLNIPWEIQEEGIWTDQGHFYVALASANLAADKIGFKSDIKFEPVNYWSSGGVSISYNKDRNPTYALTTKGGHNGEDHNHNDLGSYVLYYEPQNKTNNNTWVYVTGDVQNRTYPDGYFGEQRYQFPVASSWGHPVPTINNQLQSVGDTSQAKTLHYEDDSEKTITVFDITSAYRVKGLEKLLRVIYWDKSTSMLSILDYAKGEGFNQFSTPIITASSVQITNESNTTMEGYFKTDPKNLSNNQGSIDPKLNLTLYSPKGLKMTKSTFKEVETSYHKADFEITDAEKNPWIYYQITPTPDQEQANNPNAKEALEANVQRCLELIRKFQE
jgi:hypothetical protein